MSNTENTANKRYVLVDNQKVYLNPEQQKAWDKFINDARNRARREGICGQPDYHKCFGDCDFCPYCIKDNLISIDDERYFEGLDICESYTENQPTNPEDIFISHETERSVYATAARLVKNGDRILRLKAVDGLSTYEIGRELGMPRTTVQKYLDKLMKYFKEHRTDFIDW